MRSSTSTLPSHPSAATLTCERRLCLKCCSRLCPGLPVLSAALGHTGIDRRLKAGLFCRYVVNPQMNVSDSTYNVGKDVLMVYRCACTRTSCCLKTYT